MEIIVKLSENKEFHFDNQRVGSLEEIVEFVKSRETLKPFITENTILLGNNKQALSQQHLESVQTSHSLNIFLSTSGTIYTGSEMHKEDLKKAFDIDYVDKNGMIDKFLVYLNCKHKTWNNNNTSHYVPYSTIFQSSGYGKSLL